MQKRQTRFNRMKKKKACHRKTTGRPKQRLLRENQLHVNAERLVAIELGQISGSADEVIFSMNKL